MIERVKKIHELKKQRLTLEEINMRLDSVMIENLDVEFDRQKAHDETVSYYCYVMPRHAF